MKIAELFGFSPETNRVGILLAKCYNLAIK